MKLTYMSELEEHRKCQQVYNHNDNDNDNDNFLNMRNRRAH